MAELLATKLAESIVSQVVRRITDLLIYESASLRGVGDDIQYLQNELKYMQCFLQDADRNREKEKLVRIWVAEVKDVACEIEDAIETYIFKVRSSYIKAFHLRELRRQINIIKDKLRSISERAQRYQIKFNEGESSSLRNLRRSCPNDEEEDVIIMNDTTMAASKAQLMKDEDRRCVVSIVGMGGLGKTTLAKKVYNDRDVKTHFDCSAWVFISQQYVARETHEEILMQIGFQSQHERRNFGKRKYTKELLQERKNSREILKDLEDHELIDLLKDELKHKRYLIILDDIWSEDAWFSIQSAFPKGKSGSKVLLTTRIESVASSADSHSPTIKPPLLTPTESWELLKRKAFPGETSQECAWRPSKFEKLGKEMVGKCGGLPIAIVVLGGLLRQKCYSIDEWKKMGKDVESHIINKLKSNVQQYRVEDILDLSFQDLPFHLKPCFLYLGSFPEDSEIPKRRLLRLWIAEGFIQAKEKETLERITMEDVAEQYLEELIDRCMVQVGKRDHTGKGVKTCRLHDLMRDYCMSKAKEELFLEIVQPNETYQFPTTNNSRRIAIHVNHGLVRHKRWVKQVHPHVRSLLCFVPTVSLRKKNFWLLRVLELDFQQRQVTCKLPKGTGNLVHLRYLKVSGVAHRLKLPQSVGNLKNLQTLDLRGNILVVLPITMSRLRNLKHVLFPNFYFFSSWAIGGFRGTFGDDALAKVETLKCIRAVDLIRHSAVIPLSNITDLGIRGFTSDEEVSLVLESLSSHSELSRLRSLWMELDKGEFPKLELLSHCYALSRLHLVGALSQENLSFLPESLTKLELRLCLLNQDKLSVVERLPNLRILRISKDRVARKWVLSVNGFPKLEILTLVELFRLEEWEVEKGAMRNLKRLDIESIPRLRMIPEGLKYVTTLLELNISLMERAFKDRVRVNEHGIQGEDFNKVCHIPSITFLHTVKKPNI